MSNDNRRSTIDDRPVHGPKPDARSPFSGLGRILVVATVLILAAGVGVGGGFARDAAAHEGRIYPGISIGGIEIGGMTRQQAAALAEAMAAARLTRRMIVRVDGEPLNFTYEQLGLVAHTDEAIAQAYAWGHSGAIWQRVLARLELLRHPVNVDIRYSWDRAAATSVLAPLVSKLDATPQDAEVTVRDGHVVLTRPSRDGRALDLQVSAARIREALDAGADEVEAVVEVTPPQFTTENARDLQAPLTSYTTKIAGVENRLFNITLAASFIRGTILAPGEVFSYNRVVGPRTTARGFKEAPVLIDDELVPGDGGGVCQVSSTLFNVALLADLEIVSRANHSRPVAYLPVGRDATVNYGALDLQFKNTTGHYLMLWARVVGRHLTFIAYGTPTPGKTVTIVVSEQEVIPPPDGTVTKQDPELEEGKVVTREAQPGYKVRTYRVVSVNGEVVRRDLVTTSFYRPVARTIKIGIKKVKPDDVRSEIPASFP